MKTVIRNFSTLSRVLVAAVFIVSLFPTSTLAMGYPSEGSYEKSWFKDQFKKEQFEKDRLKEYWSNKKHNGKKYAKKDCDNTLSIPLYIKGDKRVGKVTIRLQTRDLKVRYEVDKGWYIKQTNLDISESYDGLHLNPDSSPNVEAFPYKSKHFRPVTSADFSIDARQWSLGTGLYVAAQAVVVKKSHGKYDDGHNEHHHNHHRDYHSKTIKKEAWALGEKFPGQELAGYFIYKLKSCDKKRSTIQFSDPIYTVKEGGPAAVITAIRSGNLKRTASVKYTTIDGTAISGVDYEFTQGVLTFAPGQTSAQFEVNIIDNTEVEPVKNFTMKLSHPLGAKLGQQKTAIVEIEDDDEVAMSVLAIDRIIPNPVDEGATVIVYVTRTGDLSSYATVDFRTQDGTAIGSTECGPPAAPVETDYEQIDGTLFFDTGISELSVEITTCNNNPREDTDETFDFEIFNPVGAELEDDGDGDPNSNRETVTIIEGT